MQVPAPQPILWHQPSIGFCCAGPRRDPHVVRGRSQDRKRDRKQSEFQYKQQVRTTAPVTARVPLVVTASCSGCIATVTAYLLHSFFLTVGAAATSPPHGRGGNLFSFLRMWACGWCGVAPGVRWATRVCCRSRSGGPVFFEVRFRGWGIHGCVLLTEIYKMSHRTYV